MRRLLTAAEAIGVLEPDAPLPSRSGPLRWSAGQERPHCCQHLGGNLAAARTSAGDDGRRVARLHLDHRRPRGDRDAVTGVPSPCRIERDIRTFPRYAPAPHLVERQAGRSHRRFGLGVDVLRRTRVRRRERQGRQPPAAEGCEEQGLLARVVAATPRDAQRPDHRPAPVRDSSEVRTSDDLRPWVREHMASVGPEIVLPAVIALHAIVEGWNSPDCGTLGGGRRDTT